MLSNKKKTPARQKLAGKQENNTQDGTDESLAVTISPLSSPQKRL